MKRVLAVTCFLLLYGSLYPWTFRSGPSLIHAASHVFSAWPARFFTSDIKDIVLNLVIYLPVGFFGYLSGGPRSRLRHAVFAGSLGFLLSFSVEVLQHYVPSRQPSAVDLLCNTISAWSGVLLGCIYEAILRTRFHRITAVHRLRPSSALLLLMLWLSSQTAPVRLFANSMVGKVRHLLVHPVWDWSAFAAATLGWLLAGLLLKHLVPLRTARLLCWGLIPSIALARLISPGQELQWPGLLGAAAGVLLLYVPVVHETSFRRILAAVWVAFLLLDGLRPLAWMNHPSRFEWIPFRDMLNSAWQSSIVVLLRKLWLYGAAFWLLTHAGARRVWALLSFTLLIVGVEIAQQYLPARSAGLTDPALVALASLLIWAVEYKYERDEQVACEATEMNAKLEKDPA